ncbi:MAG: imelysin family protein [Marinobacterium sp.]|nr:imelysin family protein [Marinobacterium sp.]
MMFNRQAFSLLGTSLMLLVAPSLQAAPSENQWQAFSTAAVTNHILPRYQALADSSASLSQATQQFCKQPTEQGLAQAKQDFHNTMAAWQGIQHVQFGPVEILMRNFSLQFWPDKKNLGGKQLAGLLNNEDPASLSDERFRAASVAIKGLPAMERLLFADDALNQFQNHPFRCQLTVTVADYIAGMGRDIRHEWQQYADEFKQIDGEGYYEDTTEAVTDLLKAMVEPVEVVRDMKILRPLGKSEQRAKPRRSESWRSERSLDNMIINLQALHELYRTGGDNSPYNLLKLEGASEQAERIEQRFQSLISQLKAVPAPLYRSVKTPEHYQQLRQISVDLKAQTNDMEAAMKPLNIQLGFNSRDGD